eukprot:16436588-Heterocapsa_arctica.AAC.1
MGFCKNGDVRSQVRGRAEQSCRDRQGIGGGLAAMGRVQRLLRDRGERAERIQHRQLPRRWGGLLLERGGVAELG